MSAAWFASRRGWTWLVAAALVTIRHDAALGEPAQLQLHSAIYDPLRQRMVVFAGSDGSNANNQLWQLSLDRDPRWDPIAPTGLPPVPRFGHSAIYDPVRDQMI